MSTFTSINVSRETLSTLTGLWNSKINEFENYADLVLWWNQKVNLVSRNLDRETLMFHVKHSLAVMLFGMEEDFVVDIGSGAGMPGIPIAIAFPEKEVQLVDKVNKKMMAAGAMASKLKLKNVKTRATDIGSLQPQERSAVISKHAFKLNEIENTLWSYPSERMLFLKGDDFRQEIKLLQKQWDVRVLALTEVFDEPFFDLKYVLELKPIRDEQP